MSFLDVPTKKPKEGNPTVDFFQLFFAEDLLQPTFWGFRVFGGGRFPSHLAQRTPQRGFSNDGAGEINAGRGLRGNLKPSEKERWFVPHLSGEGF